MDTREKKRTDGRRPSGASAARGKNRSAAAVKDHRRKTSPKQPAPDVVYTQPMPFNQNRFILKLITVIAVVIAMVFGMSIFFKVKTVTVAGANKYTVWNIREASGIQEGENLLSISEAQISSRITSQLPYVNKVRVGIKLPDTVKIEVEELDVVYAVEASDASWWLMRADGLVVDSTNAADAERYTKLLGVQLESPQIGQQSAAAEPVQDATGDAEQTVPVTVRSGERLDAAISILQYLESNGIIGQAASVNVEDLGQLEIWYEDRFQILLGDTTQLSYKIKMVCIAINEHMETYDSGVLDASLTIQPDPEKEYQVIYSPFE